MHLLLLIYYYSYGCLKRIQMYIYILTVQTLFDSPSDYCIEVSLIPEKEHAFWEFNKCLLPASQICFMYRINLKENQIPLDFNSTHGKLQKVLIINIFLEWSTDPIVNSSQILKLNYLLIYTCWEHVRRVTLDLKFILMKLESKFQIKTKTKHVWKTNLGQSDQQTDSDKVHSETSSS